MLAPSAHHPNLGKEGIYSIVAPKFNRGIMKQDSLQKAEQPTVEVEKKRDRTEQTAEIEKRCAAAFGLKDGKVAFQILSQAANLQRLTGSEEFLDNFTKAFGTLSEIGPKGALEMLLAVQIMGVHLAALKFLANASRRTDSRGAPP